MQFEVIFMMNIIKFLISDAFKLKSFDMHLKKTHLYQSRIISINLLFFNKKSIIKDLTIFSSWQSLKLTSISFAPLAKNGESFIKHSVLEFKQSKLQNSSLKSKLWKIPVSLHPISSIPINKHRKSCTRTTVNPNDEANILSQINEESSPMVWKIAPLAAILTKLTPVDIASKKDIISKTVSS